MSQVCCVYRGGIAPALADTSVLTEANGWQKIKSISQSDIASHYYAFVANDADLMLGLKSGATQGNDALSYQTSADPRTDYSKLFVLEANGSNYTLRCVSHFDLPFQTEYSGSSNDLRWRTNDAGDGGADWYGFGLSYADGAWTLTSTKYNRPLGIYNNVTGTPTEGAEIGANDAANGQKFQIYAIEKSKLVSTDGASADNPVDMTPYIKNYNFGGNGANSPLRTYGWTCTRTGGNFDFNGAVEAWHNSNFDINQTLTDIPNGKYTVSVQLANGENSNTAYLYATSGGNTTTATVTQSCAGSDFDTQETSMANDASYGKLTVDAIVTDGTLTIGIKEPSTNTWIVFDNFSLKYVGEIDLSEYKTSLANAVSAAEAVNEGTIPSAAYTALKTVVTDNNKEYTTADEYSTAISAITNATTKATALQGTYTTYTSMKTTAETLRDVAYTETTEGSHTTFADAVTTQETAAEAATTSDAITAATTAIKTAGQTYIKAAKPSGDNASFDITAFVLTNVGFDDATGWTLTDFNGSASNNTQKNYTTGQVAEAWENGLYTKAHDISQESSIELPAGIYEVSAAAMATLQSDGDNASAATGVYIYVGDNQTAVATKNAADAMFTAKGYVPAGKVKVGFHANADANANWMAWDNVTLKYYGDEKASDFYSQINGLVATANAITGSMSEKTKSALNSATETANKSVTDQVTDFTTLRTNISNLQTAINNANSSVSANKKVANGEISTSNGGGWTCTTGTNLAVNTWSGEGSSDGSNMLTPFMQDWLAKGSTLGGGEIYYELKDLVAGTYNVSALVRVLNESGGATTGASFFVNDNSMEISAETGAQTCTNGIYENVSKYVTIEDGGSIKLGFTLTSPAFNWISFKNVKISNATETVTVTDAGWATYSAAAPVDYSGTEGLTAYTAKYDATNKTVTLTEVTTVPANTPVVLKGNAGTYTLTVKENTTTVDNDLKVSATDVTSDGSQYALTKMESTAGFAKVQSGVVIPAGKAYLVVSDATAKSFIAIDGGAATGINGVAAESVDDGNVYNVAGQKVSSSYKGLVIKNGKKYLRK